MERRTNKWRKEERKMARFTAFVCVTVVTSGFLLSGCAGPGSKDTVEEKDTSILVETALPKTESIELDGDFIGTVEAEDEVTVVAKIGGDVTAAYFEEGDRVNAGDLLFTIDDRSAQISMDQAQASLESANASVNSASAGVSVAELNLLYTQEQIKETLGKVDTNQMQLENAVASAKYALKAAEENESIAAEQFGIARDNYKDLEDSLDDLKDDANNMGKYARQLKTVKSNYDKIKNGTMSLPSDIESKYLAEGNTLGNKDAEAAYYIKELAGAESEYELGVMISSAESSESSMRSQRSSLDGNKDSARLAQIQAAIGKETAKNNVLSAEDAKRLAEKMLQDYELYTKAVIIAGANAQLAGSNSNLIAAQSGMTQAQAGVKQAQAGVEAAQLQLEYTQVTAPVSGIIREKNVTVNNMAAQGSTAYVITADSGSNVTFYVSEAVMKELTVGQQAKVERNGETYQATISENAGVADAVSGLFKIKAQLSESDAQKLIAGTTVKITLATRRADQVMTIPVDSVYYEAQKAFVYCMEGNKAVKTEIETGITNNETVEVKSGLTKDSQIITTWASQLKDGAEVKLRDAAETKDDSSNDNIEETATEEAADETAAQ